MPKNKEQRPAAFAIEPTTAVTGRAPHQDSGRSTRSRTKKVAISRSFYVEAAPEPEFPERSLTERYDSGFDPVNDDVSWILRINHAGKYILLRLIEVLKSTSARRSRIAYELVAFQRQGSELALELYEVDRAAPLFGKLTALGVEPILVLTSERVGRVEFVRRIDDRPMIPAPLLKHLEGDRPQVFLREELFPIHHRGLQWVLSQLSPDVFGHFDELFSMAEVDRFGQGNRYHRESYLRALNEHVRWVFSTTAYSHPSSNRFGSGPCPGWHPDDLPQIEAFARAYVHNTTLERGVHSGLTPAAVVNLMAQGVALDGRNAKAAMDALWRHLRLPPFYLDLRTGNKGTAELAHTYKMTSYGVEADFPLGAEAVFVTIEKLGPPPIWTHDYELLFVNVNIGIAAGKNTGSRGETVFATPDAWLPEDFLGEVVVTELGASLAVPPITIPGGETIMPGKKLSIHSKTTIFGSKNHHPVVLNGLGFSDIHGFGAGAGFSYKTGRLVSRKNFKANAHLDAWRHHINKREAIEEELRSRGGNHGFHFDYNDARLTAAGRHRVRRLCAEHLAFLGDGDGTLTITGHADRIGRAHKNRELSRCRAKNVLQAVRDILGPALAIPNENIKAIGAGELGHQIAGADDKNAIDPHWRRVDVAIDGERVVSLEATRRIRNDEKH